MPDGQAKLEAEVLTPEGEVFRGELIQLSTRTAVGEVGILARHIPMVARLVPAELRLHKSESEVERYAQGGDNPELKAWAGKTLPALKHHLEMAENLGKKKPAGKS